MSTAKIKRLRLLITLLVTTFLIAGTIVAIRFAKGYRPDLEENRLNGTGLLSVTSYPRGGKVLINGRLTTLTDDTLYLKPDKYHLEIKKPGFSPWKKQIPIKKELVSNANARLFPSPPSISPLTYSGVKNPAANHNHSKIVFAVTNNDSDEENGLYVMSLSNNLLSSFPVSQIVNNVNFDYSKSQIFWSPNGNQILAIFTDKNNEISAAHLLNSASLNKTNDIVDVTIRLNLILKQWQEELSKINQTSIRQLPRKFQEYIKNTQIINFYISPNHEKLLYQVSAPLTLPPKIIKENLPSINPTPQDRNLKPGNVYVYDSLEDTNYLIHTNKEKAKIQKSIALQEQNPDQSSSNSALSNPQIILKVDPKTSLINQFNVLAAASNSSLTLDNLSWYPTSAHIIKTYSNKVEIIDYDNQNPVTIFQTNIKNRFTIPTNNGTYLIILTNLNQQDQPDNLFSLDLK